MMTLKMPPELHKNETLTANVHQRGAVWGQIFRADDFVVSDVKESGPNKVDLLPLWSPDAH